MCVFPSSLLSYCPLPSRKQKQRPKETIIQSSADKISFPARRAGFQVPTEAEEKQKGHRSSWGEKGRCRKDARGRRAIRGRDSTSEPWTHMGPKSSGGGGGGGCWGSIPKMRMERINFPLDQAELTSDGNLCVGWEGERAGGGKAHPPAPYSKLKSPSFPLPELTTYPHSPSSQNYHWMLNPEA